MMRRWPGLGFAARRRCTSLDSGVRGAEGSAHRRLTVDRSRQRLTQLVGLGRHQPLRSVTHNRPSVTDDVYRSVCRDTVNVFWPIKCCIFMFQIIKSQPFGVNYMCLFVVMLPLIRSFGLVFNIPFLAKAMYISCAEKLF